MIIWHSRTGAARAMARAAFAGAGGAAAGRARLVAAPRARAEMLLAASAYLFVAPENLGSLSGAMKEMFDRCYYPLLGRIEKRPYACAIAAGTDGEGALRQVERIATGWRLRRVAEPIIVRGDGSSQAAILAPKRIGADARARCDTLGAALAEGVALGIF